MIKREITYKYWDNEGKEIEETGVFWFHLSEEELMEWMAEKNVQLDKQLEEYVKQEDTKNLFAFVKKLMLYSYGVRQEGGREFQKSDELRAKWENSFAYKKLFAELTLGEGCEERAAAFLNGVIPDLSYLADQDKPKTKVVDVESKAVN